MTFSPIPLDRGHQGVIRRFLFVLHRNGVPQWFGYPQIEFTANMAMFLPLGFLIGLLVPRRRLWFPFIVVPVLSTVIEVLQGLFLSERFGSVLDVVANTIGGYIGLATVILLRVFFQGRDRKMVARAVWERDVAVADAHRAARPQRHPVPRADVVGPAEPG